MRLGKFRKHDEGQVLVVVALAAVVLISALALALDSGYGLTQRRVMQNAADAGALAAARLLASNVVTTDQGSIFTVYERQTYCTALGYATDNRVFRPSNPTETLTVEWSATGTAGSFVALSTTSNCADPASAASGPFVDPTARFILVRADVQYRGLVAQVAGQPAITAAATGMARVTGAPVPSQGPSWPMVRHFNAADFTTGCGNPCNPTTVDPVVFWDSNDANIVYNSFMGLIDLSRFSPNEHRNAGQPTCNGVATPGGSASCVPQLITGWDQSGAAPTGKPTLFGGNACNQSSGNAVQPPAAGGTWFTNGNENSQSFEKDCSILNWFGYLFQGQLTLDSSWSAVAFNGGSEWREQPSALGGARSSCTQAAGIGLPAPSCAGGSSALGDWVEAAHTGNVGNNIATPLQWYIDTHGRTDPVYSGLPVSNGNGAPLYGKYVVILVYLWDCAETYSPGNPAGNRWSLTRPRHGSDCSSMQNGNDVDSHDSIDRVHLFSVAPFTFYRGLVDSNSIRGFWGGLVSDPGNCSTNPGAPACSLNEFSNGIFLVPPP
jgi:Flp pilus assembly protein TadG